MHRPEHSHQPPPAGAEAASLRSRYLMAMALMAIVLFGTVWLLQHYIVGVRTERINNIEAHQTAARQNDLLRDAVLGIERSLRGYLAKPTEQQRKTVFSAVDLAYRRERTLAAGGWIHQNGFDAQMEPLDDALRTLPARLGRLLPPRGTANEAALNGLLAPLWQQLRRVDQALETSAQTDVAQLTRALRNVVKTLWLIAGMAFVLTLLGFFLFERYVLNPITLMARALRDEAHGRRDLVLPVATTAETQHLVEAFNEMRRLVLERQQALEHQALHDTLTGLPNRTLLQDRLRQAIHHLRRAGYGYLALLVMDLDGFKEINDTLGHPIGDGLLQQLSDRLLREVRESDTVARLGGDEFAIVLEEADETEARRKAARILSLLEKPFEVSGQSLYVAGSIGIAIYPHHALTPQELSRRADVAMYVAKREKNGIAVYDTRQDHYTLQRLAQANDLRSAINNEHLQLYFQPQIDLRNNTFSGVEALLRWHHPQRGFISPEDFIPVAEQTGLIRHLTYWVLDQALARCAAWRNHGRPVGSMSVNLSAYNLQDPDLYLEVARLLKKWGVPPYLLVLEITESSMMANPARAQATLEKLNDIGVQVAIDDFGTGFSSLSHLKQLPVDKLKIDKSFVIQMSEDEDDAMIVRSTIDLAHNLGLEVVAEGVESDEAMELLRELRCDAAQGYHISRPLSATELEQWLESSPYCENFEEIPGPDAPGSELPTTH